MRPIRALALLSAATVAVAPRAHAQFAPQSVGSAAASAATFVNILVNGKQVGSASIQQGANGMSGAVWAGSTSGWQISLSATLDVDPFITFGVAGTNFTGSAITFGFLFSTPIVSQQYYGASSSLSGTVTRTDGRATTGGTATVTPSVINVLSGFAQPGTVNLGVNLGNAACSATTTTSLNPVSSNCSFANSATSTFGPQTFNQLQALVGFTVSPGGIALHPGGASAASFTGAIVINAVPEPASLALVALGLLSLAATSRRQRSS